MRKCLFFFGREMPHPIEDVEFLSVPMSSPSLPPMHLIVDNDAAFTSLKRKCGWRIWGGYLSLTCATIQTSLARIERRFPLPFCQPEASKNKNAIRTRLLVYIWDVALFDTALLQARVRKCKFLRRPGTTTVIRSSLDDPSQSQTPRTSK